VALKVVGCSTMSIANVGLYTHSAVQVCSYKRNKIMHTVHGQSVNKTSDAPPSSLSTHCCSRSHHITRQKLVLCCCSLQTQILAWGGRNHLDLGLQEVLALDQILEAVL